MIDNELMNELQDEIGPVNPYARIFFWCWGLALLALAGLRANVPNIPKPMMNQTEPQTVTVPSQITKSNSYAHLNGQHCHAARSFDR